MSFLDIEVIRISKYIFTIGGIIFILSFILSIYYNWRLGRKLRSQTSWKIQMANKEILSPLTGSVSGGAFPERDDINALINKKSREYKIKRKKLYSVEDFVEEIISFLFEQQMMDPKERNELIRSLREKTSVPLSLEKEEKKMPTGYIRKLFQILGKKKYIYFQNEEKEEIKEKEMIEKRKEIKKLEFYDDFEEFKGWNKYGNGIVKQSTDFYYSGKFSLKKDINGDPHGGFKKIGINLFFEDVKGFIFTGKIYRPTIATTSLGDRLAIEDDKFNGYGFCINHSRDTIFIERRDRGKFKVISPINNINPLKDRWYGFEFHMRKEGKFILLIKDDIGGQIINVNSFIDNKYSSFNQVAVHGGFPYYIDDIKIETIL